MKTYCVSLYFDSSSAAAVHSIVEGLSALTENDFLIRNKVPSHMTLGAFHAEDSEIEKMKALFSDFARKNGKTFFLDLSGFDNFLDKVIFLRPSEKSMHQLSNLNERLHDLFLPHFEPGNNRNYLPCNWIPHIALAVKLNHLQFEKAFGAVQNELKDEIGSLKTVKVNQMTLALCKPYTELFRISLSSDSLTPLQRHKNMAAIRSTGNKLETSLRSQLFRFGFRFRKNDRRLAGSPDIVFPHYHAVVFINGCFWHAHGWKSSVNEGKMNLHENTNQGTPALEIPMSPKKTQPGLSASNLALFSYNNGPCDKFHFPKSNTAFWLNKFTRNQERDRRDISKLMEEGWRVAVVWECSITGRDRREKIHDIASRISLWLEEGFDELFREF